MNRIALLGLLVGVAAAVAAPVPREVVAEEQFRKLYGTRVDEKKHAKFTSFETRLRIAIADQSGGAPRHPLESPRVMREVIGDFVARVGVTCPLPPVPGGLTHTFIGGGMVVVLGEGYYLSIERSHCLCYDSDSKLVWGTSFDATHRRFQPAHSESCYSNDAASDQPLKVALTRRGKKFTAEVSLDGKKWQTLKTHEFAAPEKLMLGLFARHNTGETQAITFSDYTITKPE